METFGGEFNYVVGYVDFGNRLHCYGFGGQVQFGTRQGAIELRDYVRQTTLDKNHVYKVYKLNLEEVK